MMSKTHLSVWPLSNMSLILSCHFSNTNLHNFNSGAPVHMNFCINHGIWEEANQLNKLPEAIIINILT